MSRVSTVVVGLPLVAAVLAMGTGCAGKIDRFTVDKVVDVGLDVPDVGKVCALGSALAHPLASLSKKHPDKALLIAEATAALCLEEVANQAELDMDRAKANLSALGEQRAAEITDARIRSERAHADAAARFERSWQHLQADYGPIGDGDCPRIKEKDEIVYFMGLVSGTLALIHDRRGGGTHDIPLDRLLEVARGAECLDDERWWHVPSSMRAGAWATIPGSGPEGVDPWAMLAEAADKGDGSGVRVARAMQSLIGGNSGATEVVAEAIKAHAASIEATPQAADWALLDRYAYQVTLHESDRVWMAAEGHRTESFGDLPSDEEEQIEVPDLFGGGDPFGTAPPPEADVPDEGSSHEGASPLRHPNESDEPGAEAPTEETP